MSHRSSRSRVRGVALSQSSRRVVHFDPLRTPIRTQETSQPSKRASIHERRERALATRAIRPHLLHAAPSRPRRVRDKALREDDDSLELWDVPEALAIPRRARLEISAPSDLDVNASDESNVARFHAFSASLSCAFPVGFVETSIKERPNYAPTPEPRIKPLVEMVNAHPCSRFAPIKRRKYPLQSSFRVGHASHRPAPAPGHAFHGVLQQFPLPGPTSATALSHESLSTTGTTNILDCSNRRLYAVAAVKSRSTFSAEPYTTDPRGYAIPSATPRSSRNTHSSPPSFPAPILSAIARAPPPVYRRRPARASPPNPAFSERRKASPPTTAPRERSTPATARAWPTGKVWDKGRARFPRRRRRRRTRHRSRRSTERPRTALRRRDRTSRDGPTRTTTRVVVREDVRATRRRATSKRTMMMTRHHD